MNKLTLRMVRALEMVGVVLRIASFGAVGWLGGASPWALVWLVNTAAALLLLRCAIFRRDMAYSVLNFFWVLVGVVGMVRTTDLLRHWHSTNL